MPLVVSRESRVSEDLVRALSDELLGDSRTERRGVGPRGSTGGADRAASINRGHHGHQLDCLAIGR
jgi:hypothetical protein